MPHNDTIGQKRSVLISGMCKETSELDSGEFSNVVVNGSLEVTRVHHQQSNEPF